MTSLGPDRFALGSRGPVPKARIPIGARNKTLELGTRTEFLVNRGLEYIQALVHLERAGGQGHHALDDFIARTGALNDQAASKCSSCNGSRTVGIDAAYAAH